MRSYKLNINIKQKIWNWLQSNNVANRGKFDGDKTKQLIGLLGEFETHNYLLGYYPELKFGFDNGIDIIYNKKKIDVKTMGRNVDCKPHFANNFLECQINYESNYIIFTSINLKNNTFQICGYLHKDNLKKKGILIKKGDKRFRDNGTFFIVQENFYEINNESLTSIHDLKYERTPIL
jgi:hypothetical protein